MTDPAYCRMCRFPRAVCRCIPSDLPRPELVRVRTRRPGSEGAHREEDAAWGRKWDGEGIG